MSVSFRNSIYSNQETRNQIAPDISDYFPPENTIGYANDQQHIFCQEPW